jgi:hypothetical protein
MQENNFWCLRNPCENTFSKLPIFFVHKKKRSKTCKGIDRMQHTRKYFSLYFFFQNANITIRHKHQNGK